MSNSRKDTSRMETRVQSADAKIERSPTPRWLAALVVCGLLVSTALGCGDGRPKRHQVSGQVLIDGQPLTIGIVRFIPTGGRPSVGKLDEEGKFTLSSYGKNDGVVPGKHLIEINASEEISSNSRKWHAPPKYFNYRTSGLSQEVSGPTDEILIEITWDGGEPFVQKY